MIIFINTINCWASKQFGDETKHGHACLAITDQKAFKKHNSKITLNPFIKIVTQTLLTDFPTAELR